MSIRRPKLGRGVVVVGSGVVGLTTAYYLATNGWDVSVWSVKARPSSSRAACALFLPYFGTAYGPWVGAWARTSWKVFADLCKVSSSGVRSIRMIEMWREYLAPSDLLSSLTSVDSYRRDDLPRDFCYVWDFNTWMIDIPIYVGYLRNLCVSVDVTIHERLWDRSAEVTDDVVGIVDCCGHWSSREFGVADIQAVRGQTVILQTSRPSFALGGDEFVLAPRSDGTLFGSLWQPNDSSYSVRLSDTTHLLNELGVWCESSLLSGAGIVATQDRVVNTFAGVRPFRENSDFVSLDSRSWNGLAVIHNTGHGGSGVALAWGAAYEVDRLLKEIAVRSI